MRIVAYAFGADHWCEGCAREAFTLGSLRAPEGADGRLDENGIPEDLIDSEGNPLHPVFAHEESPEEGLFCGGCRDCIVEPRMEEAHFDRFSLSLPIACVRDCSRPGPVDDAVAFWAGSRSIDWSGISEKDIRAELKETGAWDEEELRDDEENRRRILWLAAGRINDDWPD